MKTAIFDLGNVLIYFSHKKMCEQIAKVYDTSFESIHDLLFKRKVAKDYELGLLSSEGLHRKLSLTLGKEGDFFSLMKAAADIFEANPDMLPIVQKLKKNGTRLILLSNTCEAHYNYAYSHFPIVRLFDERILSFEVKMQKPNPLIFQKVITMAGGKISDCFYTDDIQENITAARKQGLDSELFTHAKTLEEQLLKRGFLAN